LTRRASNKLAQNLNLRIKDAQQGVCRTNTAAHRSSNTANDGRKGHNEGFNGEHHRSSYKPVSPTRYLDKTSTRRHVYSEKSQNTKNTYRAGAAYTQRNNGDDAVHCYNCYETNHTVQTCKWENPIVCRTCGQSGHKEKHHQQIGSWPGRVCRSERTIVPIWN
jgi:hypothetical protein